MAHLRLNFHHHGLPGMSALGEQYLDSFTHKVRVQEVDNLNKRTIEVFRQRSIEHGQPVVQNQGERASFCDRSRSHKFAPLSNGVHIFETQLFMAYKLLAVLLDVDCKHVGPNR